MVRKKEDSDNKVKGCSICRLDDDVRSGVEVLTLISCATWNIAAQRASTTFNVKITPAALRKHMQEHELCKTVKDQGVILSSIRGEDGAPGIISTENMLQTLLLQGMLDLAKGKIRCKNVNELLMVSNALHQIQDRKNAAALIEDGDIAGFYAAMAAYGTAIRDTVSPQQLVEIVTKANALGAMFDISNATYADVVEVTPESVEDIMQVAVDDYKKLGRGRTREELIEAGVLDGFTDGLNLPQ